MHRIQIYDTTLRDGAQGEGVDFSLQDKLEITQRLDAIGVDYIEGGYPLSNEKDIDYFRRVAMLPLQHAKVCAFGMTRRKGIQASEDPGMQALLQSGAPVCTIVGKTSDFHATEVLRVELDENLAMIRDSVRLLVDAGREVIYDAEHFFDGWKANADYAAATIRAAAEAGANLIVLCDTNGGSMPAEITDLTRQACGTLQPYDAGVGIHCHDDCGLAIANSLAAVDAGAVQVQGTINGFGERCGNADLITVMANLALKRRGYTVLAGRESIAHLTDLSRFVYDTANMNFRNNQPFVGTSAFAHKGGMHAHAIARDTSSYEHIAPDLVGNERRVLISELSGRSNIVALTTKHHLKQDAKLLQKILAEVVRLENDGYQFEAASATFDLLVKKCAGTFHSHFQRIKYHVEVGTDGRELITEATVKLKIDASIRHEVAEGDGPVNALDAALRKALNGSFPGLRTMRLVDYRVRVVNSEAGTAARIRVVVESADSHDVWGTVGVSENIIDASWMALVDAFEYKLHKDELAAAEQERVES